MGLYDDLKPENDNPYADLSPETDTDPPKGPKSVEALKRTRFANPRAGIASTILDLGTTAVAGIAGIGSGIYEGAKALTNSEQRTGVAPDFNAPAETVRNVQQAGQEMFAPRTEQGQQSKEAIQKGIETAGKVIKYPLSAIPFAIGGKEEQQEFMDVPIGDYLGELAQDLGASPLVATMAHLVPDATLTAVGVKGAKSSVKPPKPKPPTVSELKTQSGALYKIVDDSGVTISPAAAQGFVARVRRRMTKEGIDPDLTKKSDIALKRLTDEDLSQGLTLERAEILRRKLKSAQDTLEASDQRLASIMVDELDRFIEGLQPNMLAMGAVTSSQGVEIAQYLKSARSLWSRARKTEAMEDLIDRAQIGRANFSGSGYENALRREFIALAKNKRKMKMFSKGEQALIRRVANGTRIGNILRQVGKAAPTGIVSAGMSSGAGFVIGGPFGALAVPAVGGIARSLATRSTLKNATKARDTMATGAKSGS